MIETIGFIGLVVLWLAGRWLWRNWKGVAVLVALAAALGIVIASKED